MRRLTIGYYPPRFMQVLVHEQAINYTKMCSPPKYRRDVLMSCLVNVLSWSNYIKIKEKLK